MCEKFRLILLLLVIFVTAIYYFLPSSICNFEIIFYKNFILYSFWLFYAVGVESKVLGNTVMRFLSGVSLEIYLSHMFVFRFMEKLHVQYLFGESNWLSYIVLCLFILVGLFALIFGYKLALNLIRKYVINRTVSEKELVN